MYKRQDVESACGVDPPLLFSVRHVESGEVHAGAGGSDEEFAADTDVKPIVEQRERVAEGRFEVAVGREAIPAQNRELLYPLV